MKLRFYLHTKKGEKIYTLKETIGNKPTQEAHYKFINSKVRDAPKNN